MGRLAQHGPELGRAALGDVAMPIARARLVGAGDEAGVTGNVLGTGEPLHIREDGERCEGDHGADAGDGLEPAHVLAQGAGEVREQLIDGADLLPRLLPYRQVKADIACEFGNGGERGEEPGPARGTAQTRARAHGPPHPAQQTLGRIDLRRLDADEVTPPGQSGAQRTDRRTRDMDRGAIESPADPIAHLKRISAITFLRWAMRLAAHLMRVDHNGRQL